MPDPASPSTPAVRAATRRDPVPAVDVVIAVHSDRRPVERAVASALDGGLASPTLRVSVVCHDLDPDPVARRLRTLTTTGDLPEGVRLLEHRDGVRSPAGPFNHGLARATARFVSVMGSDDTVDPGTYARWLALGDTHRSAAVVAAVRTSAGRVPTPVVRRGRTLDLDPLRDRLAYRTAPLGLVRRSEVERLDLRFTEGLGSGEDQEFSARLWFGGGRIDYAADAGDYVVHDDQADRTTAARRDVPDLFAFATHLVGTRWFGHQDARVREALVTKILRVHVVPSVPVRAEGDGWSPRDRDEMATVVRALVDAAPGARRSLSLAESATVSALLRPATPIERLLASARSARRFHGPRALITLDPRALLRPDAAPRWVAASALLRGRRAAGQEASSGATDRAKSSMPERS